MNYRQTSARSHLRPAALEALLSRPYPLAYFNSGSMATGSFLKRLCLYRGVKLQERLANWVGGVAVIKVGDGQLWL
jgi:hypothetical protein